MLSLAGLMDDEVSHPPVIVAHRQHAVYHPSPPQPTQSASVLIRISSLRGSKDKLHDISKVRVSLFIMGLETSNNTLFNVVRRRGKQNIK